MQRRRPTSSVRGNIAVMLSRALSALVFCLTATALAAAQQPPVRVAIVGLEHGHVVGFLHEFPRQHDAQLVGIVDPTTPSVPAISANSISIRASSTTASMTCSPTSIRRLCSFTPTSPSIGLSLKPLPRMASMPWSKSRSPSPSPTRSPSAVPLANTTSRCSSITKPPGTPATLRSTTLLQQGRLGDIRKVIIRDGHQGPKEIGVQPEFLHWLTNPALDGAGALYDFGCYGADLMTWFMHGETPLSVTAVAHTDKPQIYPHVDDDATVVLQYPHAQAVLLPSWNWTFSVKDTQVYGTKAYAIADNGTHLRERFSESSPEESLTATPLAAPQDSSLHYLAAVIRGQMVPKGDLTALDTNVIVMQILDAARTSARTGKTVELQPLAR